MHAQISFSWGEFTFLAKVVHLQPPGVFLLQLLQKAGARIAPTRECVGTGRLGGAVPAVHIPPASPAVGLVKLHQQAVHDGAPRGSEPIFRPFSVALARRPLGGSCSFAVALLSRWWWCVKVRWHRTRPLLEAREIFLQGGSGVDKNAAFVLRTHATIAYVNFQKFLPV